MVQGNSSLKDFADDNGTPRSAISFIGPLGAPILAGFVSPMLGWRAVFWRVSPFFLVPSSGLRRGILLT